MLQRITIAQHRARLKTFSFQGERIAYLDEGNREGLPVVLLHGMPTSSFLYRNIAPVLAASGFRVICPDMVGFGASSKPSDAKAYAFALQAERLRALMLSLGLPSWVQVVHDLGGPWTWELAHAHPECLRGLVVMNSTAYSDGFAPPAVMKLAGGAMGGMIAFMMGNRVTGPSQIKSFFRQFMARRDLVTPELVQGHALPMQEGTTRAFLAFARRFDWWFQQFDRYSAALCALDIPAATIWGSRDKVLDMSRLTDQFARDLKIPSHRRFEVDAGHFLQEDAPGVVANHLVQFLKESAPGNC
jgi:haloalkane dehalogenase